MLILTHTKVAIVKGTEPTYMFADGIYVGSFDAYTKECSIKDASHNGQSNQLH